jgi:hypothetical protein
VFKVHLQVGGFSPTQPELDPVWGVLAEAGTPIIVHAGSGPVGTVHTGPEPFEAVLRRHPRLHAVIAHLGAPEYTEFLTIAERTSMCAWTRLWRSPDFLRPWRRSPGSTGPA